jgi:hypothetical protein
MPLYVTESGYEETRTRAPASAATSLLRTRCGWPTPPPARCNHWPSTPCPASPTDPLAALRKAAGQDALKGKRALRMMSDGMGPAIRWSADGRRPR